ncbi:MAG: hypothetical protein ACE5H2_09790 [Terriglobia bacterium]
MCRVLFLMVALCLAVSTAMAQDPVTVDPKHYKLEFENDQVRVLRISYGPHEKSVMHEHLPGVEIFLTDVHVKFTLPDGKTEEAHAKAGQVIWGQRGKHLPENLDHKPLELILVEIKTQPGASPLALDPARDPVQVDPKHYQVEFENDQVRVLRIRYGPREQGKLHTHRPRVGVWLTDAHVKHTYPDGTADESRSQAGGVGWGEAVTHQGENLSDQPFEVVVVELKRKPATTR